jgi:hypothetical protein
MTDELFDKRADYRLWIGVAIAVVVVCGGGYYWYSRNPPQSTAPVMAPPAAAPAPEAKIEHPLPTAGGPKGPLPDLNDSDEAIKEAFGQAAGGSGAAAYLKPESIIRHLVVTVDNLPRQKVAVEKRPVMAPPGTFLANGDELHATLDERNFQRFAPMIDALRKLDMQRLAAVYVAFYPLFQKAYQDLGYPNDYFNDRLVKVIDVLLATPQLKGPVDLVRPNVMYVFADQSLESRPAGQKLLIRMGPDNAAVVKAKLSELRAIITAAPLK